LDLLCLLTFSAVRRIRRLITLCSFRARASVSVTSSSLAPRRKAVSANANQRALSSGLSRLRVPRSSAGVVACTSSASVGFSGGMGAPKDKMLRQRRSVVRYSTYHISRVPAYKVLNLELTDSLIRCGPLRESREADLVPGRNTSFVQDWVFPGRPQSGVGHDEERCEADRCSTHTLVPVPLRTWGKVRLNSVSQAVGDPWRVIMRLIETGICSIVHTCVFYPESVQIAQLPSTFACMLPWRGNLNPP